MSDNYDYSYDDKARACFKETVCIDAPRIYDSCSDKDCIEDLRVYFCPQAQGLIDSASNVKVRDVEVIFTYIDLEPVAFYKGFYSVDITFFFEVKLDIFGTPMNKIASVTGLSIYNKNVVLYGSEGNVKVFSSDFKFDDFDKQGMPTRNLPKATLQVAEPIGLGAKICKKKCCPENCCRIPECICKRYGGEFCISDCEKAVYVTIGLFYIVQIQRNVQILIPAYDFCIPQKECTTSDNPCNLFSRIDFPTNEFFPPKIPKDYKSPCKKKDKPKCGCKEEFKKEDFKDDFLK